MLSELFRILNKQKNNHTSTYTIPIIATSKLNP